jgi:hypothetical protein
MLSALSNLSAGSFSRSWTDSVLAPDVTVNAEILLLKDGRFSVSDALGMSKLQLPLQFRDGDNRKLNTLPALAVGEESGFHAFLVYSTTEYEGTMYATISTLVCVPKNTLIPVVWEPNKFENKTPSGIGDVEEDPRYHLYNLMGSNTRGETTRLLPMHRNTTNTDKPWEDYNLWVYKDYQKAYPLRQLEAICQAHDNGSIVAFKIISSLKEVRATDYIYPSTIDSESISIDVNDNMDLTVHFNDIASSETNLKVKYEYEIEQLYSGIYWKKATEGSIYGKTGTSNQLLEIKRPVSADKKCRITLKARWADYSSKYKINGPTHGFASIAGTTTGRDEEDDSPHNFDDIIFQGQ